MTKASDPRLYPRHPRLRPQLCKSIGAAEDDGVLRPCRFHFADEDGAPPPPRSGSRPGSSASFTKGAAQMGSLTIDKRCYCTNIGFMSRDILALVADAGASFVQRVLQREVVSALIPHIPRSCQCILMSATTSPDVDKLKKLLLHEPVILTLSEEGQSNSDLIPRNIEQYWPKPRLLAGKVLIFVNSIDMAFRLRLFLEKFKIRSAVLNAELPQNSRLHILEEFNAGLFGILIAIDDNQTKEKDHTSRESQVQSRSTKKKFQQNLDAEFGVVREIDFKNVFTVC
uniref:RNA helicase n=1 Tax=Ananas comosus var. bracteatus TaxID=296719 RepID=A0A6V7NJ77_ANACO|nr:unnamed protein product [Ananas comosus var. bracteatus]